MYPTSNLPARTPIILSPVSQSKTPSRTEDIKIYINTGKNEYWTERKILTFRDPESHLAHLLSDRWFPADRIPDKDGFYELKLISVDADGFDLIYKWCLSGKIPANLTARDEYNLFLAFDKLMMIQCKKDFLEIYPLSEAARVNNRPADHFAYANKIAGTPYVRYGEVSTIFNTGLSLVPPEERPRAVEEFLRENPPEELEQEVLALMGPEIKTKKLLDNINACLVEVDPIDAYEVTLREIKYLYTSAPNILEPIEQLAYEVVNKLPLDGLKELRTMLQRSPSPILLDISERIYVQTSDDADLLKVAYAKRLRRPDELEESMLSTLKRLKDVDKIPIRYLVKDTFRDILKESALLYPSEEDQWKRAAEYMHILKLTFEDLKIALPYRTLPYYQRHEWTEQDEEESLRNWCYTASLLIAQWRILIEEEAGEDAGEKQALDSLERENKRLLATQEARINAKNKSPFKLFAR